MRHLRLAPMILLILALTQVRSAYVLDLMAVVAVQSLPAIGLALLLGYTGQISIGHAAFYGLGAYGSALLSLRLGVTPLLAACLAIAATGTFAYALGRPILRLQGHYLAMGTLAFGSIVSIVLTEWRSLTGGSAGLRGVPPLTLLGWSLSDTAIFAPVAWTVLLVALVLVLNLVESPAGMLMRGMGDSERAVSALGANVVRLRSQVFALSAMLAATGGALYVHWIGFVSPQPFSIGFSVRLLVMVAIGGFRNLGGVIFGVAFVSIVAEPLQDFGYYDVLTLGGLLVVIVVLFPDGLLTGAMRLVRRFLPARKRIA
ncbi:MAG: branched-chain amino acid ABC transporter permease [Acetobacteraceae bacterium]